MPRKIKIYSLAIKDVENGIDYYQLQQNGLGKKFEKQVNDTFKKIQKFPLAASIAYENVRYHVLDRFPYIILYQVDDKYIYILRIFNTHQEALYLR